MKVISSNPGGDWEVLLTLLFHGSINCRADRFGFGHCKDTGLRVSVGVHWMVQDKEPGTLGEAARRFYTGYLSGGASSSLDLTCDASTNGTLSEADVCRLAPGWR